MDLQLEGARPQGVEVAVQRVVGGQLHGRGEPEQRDLGSRGREAPQAHGGREQARGHAAQLEQHGLALGHAERTRQRTLHHSDVPVGAARAHARGQALYQRIICQLR
jgi:hypothetical protein